MVTDVAATVTRVGFSRISTILKSTIDGGSLTKGSCTSHRRVGDDHREGERKQPRRGCAGVGESRGDDCGFVTHSVTRRWAPLGDLLWT